MSYGDYSQKTITSDPQVAPTVTEKKSVKDLVKHFSATDIKSNNVATKSMQESVDNQNQNIQRRQLQKTTRQLPKELQEKANAAKLEFEKQKPQTKSESSSPSQVKNNHSNQTLTMEDQIKQGQNSAKMTPKRAQDIAILPPSPGKQITQMPNLPPLPAHPQMTALSSPPSNSLKAPPRPSTPAPMTKTTTASQAQSSSTTQVNKTEVELSKTNKDLEVAKESILNILNENTLDVIDENNNEFEVEMSSENFAKTYQIFISTENLSSILTSIFNEADKNEDPKLKNAVAKLITNILASGISNEESNKISLLKNDYIKKYIGKNFIQTKSTENSNPIPSTQNLGNTNIFANINKLGKAELDQKVKSFSDDSRTMFLELYKDISVYDLYKHNKSKGVQSENVNKLIDCSTKLTQSVAGSLLESNDKKELSKKLDFFIEIANRSYNEKDFATAYAIASAIQMIPTKVLNKLDININSKIQKLNSITAPLEANVKVLRNASKAAAGDYIPLPSRFIQDMVGIVDSNKLIIKANSNSTEAKEYYNPDLSGVLVNQQKILDGARFSDQMNNRIKNNDLVNHMESTELLSVDTEEIMKDMFVQKFIK